jgi:hypothetical protein
VYLSFFVSSHSPDGHPQNMFDHISRRFFRYEVAAVIQRMGFDGLGNHLDHLADFGAQALFAAQRDDCTVTFRTVRGSV